MTPVQAAHELGIRPQLVYGFIKHGRVKTYTNPSGKTGYVELAEVASIVKSMKHHAERDSSGKRVRQSAPVERGSILSHHGHMKGEVRARPHRISAVKEITQSAEDDTNYVWTVDPDGRPKIMYEEDNLAQSLLKHQCHIESPAALLGVLMFHWNVQGQEDIASSLRTWCETNGQAFTTVKE